MRARSGVRPRLGFPPGRSGTSPCPFRPVRRFLSPCDDREVALPSPPRVHASNQWTRRPTASSFAYRALRVPPAKRAPRDRPSTGQALRYQRTVDNPTIDPRTIHRRIDKEGDETSIAVSGDHRGRSLRRNAFPRSRWVSRDWTVTVTRRREIACAIAASIGCVRNGVGDAAGGGASAAEERGRPPLLARGTDCSRTSKAWAREAEPHGGRPRSSARRCRGPAAQRR